MLRSMTVSRAPLYSAPSPPLLKTATTRCSAPAGSILAVTPNRFEACVSPLKGQEDVLKEHQELVEDPMTSRGSAMSESLHPNSSEHIDRGHGPAVSPPGEY